MVLLNMNRKSYMGSLMPPSYLTVSGLEKINVKVTHISTLGDLYIVYACSTLMLIRMSHKVVC